MQIQISWLLQKPTDLDLHCLQRQGISGFSRTRVKQLLIASTDFSFLITLLMLSDGYAAHMGDTYGHYWCVLLRPEKITLLDSHLYPPLKILTK